MVHDGGSIRSLDIRDDSGSNETDGAIPVESNGASTYNNILPVYYRPDDTIIPTSEILRNRSHPSLVLERVTDDMIHEID